MRHQDPQPYRFFYIWDKPAKPNRKSIVKSNHGMNNLTAIKNQTYDLTHRSAMRYTNKLTVQS